MFADDADPQNSGGARDDPRTHDGSAGGSPEDPQRGWAQIRSVDPQKDMAVKLLAADY